MQLIFNPAKPAKFLFAAAASLMLTLVFSGCSATGPFQSHSAFKQSTLPSGYQSAYQSPNGYGAQGPTAPQYGGSQSRGFGGQAAFFQNGQGLSSPFVGGGNFSSGSC